MPRCRRSSSRARCASAIRAGSACTPRPTGSACMATDAPRTYDVLAMGRSCIDLYAHQIGVPITEVKSFDAYVGGCPTNVIVGAARLGLRTALLTAVGEDPVGDFVLHFLDEERVDTQFIPRKAGRRTSAVIVTIRPPDDFPLTYYRDNCADEALDVEDVKRAPVTDSKVVFLTGTGVNRETSRTATLAAAEISRRAGAQVVLDLDYRAGLWSDPASFGVAVRSLARLADLVIGTEQEVCLAADCANADLAAQRLVGLINLGEGSLVLKRGAKGAMIWSGGPRSVEVAPFPVEILNTLGAGDAFASGLLYGYVHGWPLERAARFGNASGAIVVTRHGCSSFMPTIGEIKTFVEARGGW